MASLTLISTSLSIFFFKTFLQNTITNATNNNDTIVKITKKTLLNVLNPRQSNI